MKFNPNTMKYVARVTFCRMPAVIACDGQCAVDHPTDETQTFPKICRDPQEFPTRYCARECSRSFLSEPLEDLTQYDPFITTIPIFDTPFKREEHAALQKIMEIMRGK